MLLYANRTILCKKNFRKKNYAKNVMLFYDFMPDGTPVFVNFLFKCCVCVVLYLNFYLIFMPIFNCSTVYFNF